MKRIFGNMPSGEACYLYTLTAGQLKAEITDLGASLVRLWVPDAKGNLADVVLGYDTPDGYLVNNTYFGATVGRNANRMAGSCFVLNGKTWTLDANEGPNNLHSGPCGYDVRLWDVCVHEENRIVMHLHSPHGDQGFPGNADIYVTYLLETDGIRITYDAVSDKDTLFNLTNHSYFNLAGHGNQEKAMEQLLCMPARFFNPDDAANIPTGELRPVEGTPMDFRTPKALNLDIGMDYEPLHLQGGYDHNFEVFCNPAAILTDPHSGREMAVYTDCPGIQVYSGNFTEGPGKDGVVYEKRCGIALETQFYPDSVHHTEWPQPFVKAGKPYHSETKYRFTW